MQTIDVRQLDEMKVRGDDFVLINVLSEESFNAQHIPGSHNVPVGRDDFEQQVEQLAGSKDRKVVVYCSNPACTASPTAASKLEDVGFSDVVHFPGGMEEWTQANRPVERETA